MLDADAERVAEEAVFCLVARALVEGDAWKREIAEERAVLMAFNIDVTEVVGRARREEKKKERKLGVEDASLTVLRTALLFCSIQSWFAAQVSPRSLSLLLCTPLIRVVHFRCNHGGGGAGQYSVKDLKLGSRRNV